ncbi:hypothetical protein AB0K16_50875 [Nonomuraea jabiensis]|uniref:class I adenylate-forming enzyme family protein n=1 Tax=Nonomuraea jabiensis TaxID=882448 RepID=UPI00342496D5
MATFTGAGITTAPDTVGEVVIRGPVVMGGYLKRPDETAQAIVDGWLHTGDIGYLDGDRYLFLVDRLKEMIIRGGENIYPKEIESVLYRHDGVLEAAVIGKPDPRLGELPLAYVALRRDVNVTAEELVQHCRSRLAPYKVPTEIILVDSIPKNSVRKIDKQHLRAEQA